MINALIEIKRLEDEIFKAARWEDKLRRYVDRGCSELEESKINDILRCLDVRIRIYQRQINRMQGFVSEAAKEFQSAGLTRTPFGPTYDREVKPGKPVKIFEIVEIPAKGRIAA